MALVTCHECAHEISSEAASCPHCGAKPKIEKTGMPTWATVLVGLVFLILIISAVGNSDIQSDEKAIARSAIKLCWEDYGKKSNGPRDKLLIASFCEKMEADFKKEYGRAP